MSQARAEQIQETLGAQILIEELARQGVDTAFALQGGAALPVFDALAQQEEIRVVETVHEQGATFAADGYARCSGQPGVVLVTSGPGALNTMTGLASAYMDSIPVLALTGQVPTDLTGTDAFQEADTIGMSLSVTKWSRRITAPDEVGTSVRESLSRLDSGRPRPVLLDLPKDVSKSDTDPPEDPRPQAPPPGPSPDEIEKAATLLADAQRPLILAGHGVLISGAQQELARLAKRADAPVTTTLLALGAISEQDPRSLGMLGMHGTPAANTALGECDLLLVVGARLDDRVTGDPSTFAPQAPMIHIDIDPTELGKIIQPDVGIHADASKALGDLARVLPEQQLPTWREHIAELKRDKPLTFDHEREGRPTAQAAVARLGELADDDAVVVAGVGQHQMWAALHFGFEPTHTWLTSGGLGAMGYAVPASIGAQLAAPDRQVLTVDGDGSFHMTSNELAVAVREELPVKIVVLNNESMGMVRQWQDFFHEGRRAFVDNSHLPSPATVAETYGAVGLTVDEPGSLGPTLEEALAIEDRPVVVDVAIPPHDDVFPMVPPGEPNHDYIMEGDHE